MKFTNLSRRMQECTGSGRLSLEDVLGMMTMLCDDVRFETGMAVEKCPVKDWDLLIDRLYTISYTVNYIYQKHSKSIAEFDPGGAEDDLWKQLQSVEEKCGQVREELKQLDGIKKQLENAEASLKTQVAAEKEKQQAQEGCRRRIAAMKSELERLKNSDLPQLQQTCQALEREAAKLKEEETEQQRRKTSLLRALETMEKESKALQDDVEKEQLRVKEEKDAQDRLRTQLEDLKKDAAEQEDEKKKLEKQLKEEKTFSDTAITELVNSREDLRACEEDNERLKEDLEKAQGALQQAKDEKEDCEKKLEDCKNQRSELSKKCDEIKTLIVIAQRQVEEKEKECQKKERERKDLDDQVSRITASFNDLLSKIQERKEQLVGMDKTKIEAQLTAEEKSLQKEIDDLNDKQSQCEAIRKRIGELENQIAADQAKRDELAKKKKKLEDTLDQLLADIEANGRVLAQLESEEYKTRVARCRTKLQALKQLRCSLEQSVDAASCGWEVCLEEDLQKRLKTAEATAQELQAAIREYARVWQADLDRDT